MPRSFRCLRFTTVNFYQIKFVRVAQQAVFSHTTSFWCLHFVVQLNHPFFFTGSGSGSGSAALLKNLSDESSSRTYQKY